MGNWGFIFIISLIALGVIYISHDYSRTPLSDPEYVTDFKPIANPNAYQERVDAAYEANKEMIARESEPVCGKDYEVSCLLNAALSRLLSTNVQQDPAFTVLIELTDTILKHGDKNLMERQLKILQEQELRLLTQDRKVRIAIMRLQFALGDFDGGYKTLESFKNETEDFEFVGAPPIIAIKFLRDNGRLEDATRVALQTKEWGIKIGEPKPQCFGRDSHADVIIDLIMTNLAAGRSEYFSPLFAAITEEGSPYYDSRAYVQFFNSDITSYYRDNPDAKPVPKEICLKLAEMPVHAYTKFTRLGSIGCKDEQLAIAKKSKAEYESALINDEFRIVLGEGEQLIVETESIEKDFDRYKKYIHLVYLFEKYERSALRDQAFAKAKEMYEKTDYGYDENGTNWNGNFLGTLRAFNLNEEIKNFEDRLIQRAKEGNDQRLVRDLADYLDKNHPDYEWAAKISDEYWRNKKDSMIVPTKMRSFYFQKATKLIKENKPQEARKILALIEPQFYEYSLYQIFPTLLEAEYKDALFEEIWSKRMQYCMKTAIVQRETNDPAVIAPLCANQLLWQGLTKNAGLP